MHWKSQHSKCANSPQLHWGETDLSAKISKALSKTSWLALKAFPHSLTWLIYVLLWDVFISFEGEKQSVGPASGCLGRVEEGKGFVSVCLCTSSWGSKTRENASPQMFGASSERIFTRAFILQVAAAPVTEEGNLACPGCVAHQQWKQTHSSRRKSYRDARLSSNLNNSQT